MTTQTAPIKQPTTMTVPMPTSEKVLMLEQ